MRITISISLVIFCFSCRSATAQKNIVGQYSSEGKDYSVVLNLQSDSSFTFIKKSMEVIFKSKGKWRYNLNDTIFLIRDSVVLPEMLSNGYIKDMPDKAIVKSKNTIKIGASLLKRKNSKTL